MVRKGALYDASRGGSQNDLLAILAGNDPSGITYFCSEQMAQTLFT